MKSKIILKIVREQTALKVMSKKESNSYLRIVISKNKKYSEPPIPSKISWSMSKMISTIVKRIQPIRKTADILSIVDVSLRILSGSLKLNIITKIVISISIIL